jgi:hypothetical protein
LAEHIGRNGPHLRHGNGHLGFAIPLSRAVPPRLFIVLDGVDTWRYKQAKCSGKQLKR